ncbi:MAG: RHS repeat-associated core domain-containing protein [Bacteroidota bacterium]
MKLSVKITNALLIIFFILSIIVFNNQVTASKITDFYIKSIQFKNKCPETNSPIFNKHLRQNLDYLAGKKVINNILDIITINGKKITGLILAGECDSTCSASSGETSCSVTSGCSPTSGCNPTSCPVTSCGSSTSCGSTSSPPPDPAEGPVDDSEEAVEDSQEANNEAQDRENQENVENADEIAEQSERDKETAKNKTGDAGGVADDTGKKEEGSKDETNTEDKQDNTSKTGDDPVKIATGEFTTGETDLSYSYGTLTINVQRNYLSSRLGSHSFGPCWNFNYDTRIIMGVKPGATTELMELQRLANETRTLYQNALQAYNNALVKINSTHNKAIAAQQVAAQTVDTAQNAYNIASSCGSPLTAHAQQLLEQAQALKRSADNWAATVNNTRQNLLASYANVEAINFEYQKIKAMADQSALEAELAANNCARNVYTVNAGDPAHLQYTGNNTLTFIDEDGTPHLYLINTSPDYNSTATYPNGQKNFYPTGATIKPTLPTDDKLELLADGGYRVTKKDKTQYKYSYYGQLMEIVDLNGNKLLFVYSDNHELIKIVDDYNRILKIDRQNGKIVKIIDPKGREYSYSYDSRGMLANRTDADNATAGYLYDGNLLIENTKPDGSSYKFHYIDLNGQKVVDYTEGEEGNRETFTYTPSGMYSEYTNASGILERHYYNDRYLETRIEYQDGSYKEMVYDDQNNLISYKNELGQVFQYRYDQNRNLIQAIDPEGGIESWTYNEFNKVKSHTDKLGNTTYYNYDARGNLVSVNYPDGSTVGYTYDSRGRMIEAVDQLQNKTVYSYDGYGYVTAVKDPAGNEENFENDPVGNLLKYTDQVGNTTTYEYNGDNKITKVTDSFGKTQEYTYNIRKDLIQVTDRNGNLTKLEYDRRHLLQKVTNPLGEVTEYQYRGDRKMVAKIVNGISHYTYAYDQRGNLASETQVETGAVTQYEYNQAGQLTAKIDPNGNRSEYGYNALGSLIWVKDPFGKIKSFEYNANQKVIAATDELGNKTNFDYDRMNRLIEVTDPYHNTIQYNYDLKGNLITVIDKNGNQSRYEYDQMARLIKAVDPLDNFETWQYDPRGLVTSKTDKKGNKTGYEYDGLKRLLKVTDPLNGVKQFTYDPVGNLLSRTDENGVKTSFTYDALNRITAEIDAKGNQSRYEYNYLGLVAKKINALNQETTYEYDPLGRMIKLTDAIGAVQSFEYDKNGNLVKATDQLGNSTVYGYDALNRLAEEANALDEKTSYQYDPKGNLVKMTNPKGAVYSYEYDALDRVTKEISFLGAVKSNSFDPNGNLSAQIDFNGNQTRYVYDKLNRLTEVSFPDGTKNSFSYDALDNLTSAVNNIADERFYYDELSRLVKAETRGLTGNEVKKVEFGYDKVGNPTAITTWVEENKARKISYLYDDLNRLSKVTLPDGGKVEFSYDTLNRVVERINANGTSTAYTYTPCSEVESIINYMDRRHGPDQVISSYGYIYNAKGQRIYQVEGDGNLTAYVYDPVGRIKEVYYPFADKKKVEDYKERYYFGLLPEYNEPCKFRLNIPNLYRDELASLSSQIQELNDSFNKDFDEDKGNNGKHKGQKEVEVRCGQNNLPFVSGLSLEYQNRNRIEEMYRKVKRDPGFLDLNKGFWKEEYSYDPNGNITQKRNGWGEINYQYNQVNQLMQAGNRMYQYDPNGNLTKEILGGSFIDYQYNYENRLVKATNRFKHWMFDQQFVGEVSYSYDALNRKVKKEIDPLQGSKNEAEYYIYNGLGLDILADYQYQIKQNGRQNSAGELERVNEYYYGNGSLLAAKKFDDPYHKDWGHDPLKDVTFYHQDVLGSVVMLTDRNGHVDERYQYDAWGKAYDGKFKDGFPGEGHSNNNFGFTGQRYQAELEVYSFLYRDYDPRTMRWMMVDPIKNGWNWYRYCGNDPINYVDPLGLLTIYELNHDIPNNETVYYSQKDSEWGSNKYSVYGDPDWKTADNGKPQNIARTGCGPTSAAMVISSMTEQNVTPDVAANYAMDNGYRTKQDGTSWGYFQSIGNNYGLEVKQTSNFNEVSQALNNGDMAIAAMKPGNFTTSGHYIVLSGIDNNGQVSVLDPNSKERSTSWDPNIIKDEAKQYWIYHDPKNQKSDGKKP